jgi:hypothetical protein
VSKRLATVETEKQDRASRGERKNCGRVIPVMAP